MATPYIMPIGFVDGTTKDGVVILTRKWRRAWGQTNWTAQCG